MFVKEISGINNTTIIFGIQYKIAGRPSKYYPMTSNIPTKYKETEIV